MARGVGDVTWHSSEEGGGPDVGIEILMTPGSTLWAGELSRSSWEGGGSNAAALGDDSGTWLVVYGASGRQIIGKAVDADAGRLLVSLIEETCLGYRRRVDELLEANDRYLEEGRAARREAARLRNALDAIETAVGIDEGDTYRHVKRGTFYVTTARDVEVQTSRPIVEGDTLVVYTGSGKVWARPTEEFDDGRFVRVGDPPRDMTILDRVVMALAERLAGETGKGADEHVIEAFAEAGSAGSAPTADPSSPLADVITGAIAMSIGRRLARFVGQPLTDEVREAIIAEIAALSQGAS